MGVNLRPLAMPREISLEDLGHKTIAIDAHNILHQFLSIIRQRDGTPLKDAQGRVTSHITGLLHRTANLVELGIKPVYVFDGTPHPLKMATLTSRREIKEKARDAWQQALAEGDLEEARKYAQQTSVLSPERVQEAQNLLTALGIPHVEAPGEGEAQASHMNRRGDVDCTGSQDFDCLLFGAPVLVRNIAVTGKRKMPGRQKWVQVSPERISLEEVLSSHGIRREQLVDMAILMGTDFNEGVKGIGPKTALKLVQEHDSVEEMVEAGVAPAMEHLDEIRRIFLEPRVTDDYELRWRPADEEAVLDFLSGEHQFSRDRVQGALEKFRKFAEGRGQKELFDF
ncbi:MAG TPA: flap endonuclease-1 [Thermoplasmatales archaeon]|nr:flap endonuclease-1 [Thermoplasmatales archaeon]